jgi:hypothetical protein
MNIFRQPRQNGGDASLPGMGDDEPQNVVARVLDRIIDSIKSKNKIGVKE